MSHLHRGRFIRLRHEKNAGGDGAAVLDRSAANNVDCQTPAPAAAAAKPRAKRKAKRKTKRAR
jgi:hypothetical protein